MKRYCPIFRENTEVIFPKLVNSTQFGNSIINSINSTTLYQGKNLPKINNSKNNDNNSKNNDNNININNISNNTLNNNANNNNDITPQQNIQVVNLDSIECARIKIIQELKDDNPCILNMASDKRAGGAYTTGAKAQEESLSRRTLLYHCLDDYYRKQYTNTENNRNDRRNTRNNQKWYPLSVDDIIYSPKVLTIRDVDNIKLEEKDYYSCSYISCAALRHPETDDSGQYLFYKKDAQILYNKWKSVLRLAALHGHKNIVLSAIGSGAFGVPAQHMGEMLYDLVYNDPEFNNAFHNIFIAILDPYLNTQNYKIYSAIFNPQIFNSKNTLVDQISESIEKNVQIIDFNAKEHKEENKNENQENANQQNVNQQNANQQNVNPENLSKSQKRRLREKARKQVENL